jgi:hypothetical protein
VVVVAEDSGMPPRRASVPVVIKFGGEVSARSSAVAGFFNANPAFLFVIFAAVLVVFLAIILSLAIYICKHKRKYDRGRHSKIGADAKIFANYYQRTASEFRRPNGNVNPVLLRPMSTASRRSSSETLSSDPSGPTRPAPVLNPLNPRSGSQRYSKNAMLRVTSPSQGSINRVSPGVATFIPSPPPPPQTTPSIHANGLPEVRMGVNRNNISADPMPNGSIGASYYSSAGVQGSLSSLRSNASDQSLMQAAIRENILHHSSSRDLSRIEWPMNSIPRRVKKLSWEDEYAVMGRDREISTLTDPNVSVTPLSEHPDGAAGGPQIGQSLYF